MTRNLVSFHLGQGGCFAIHRIEEAEATADWRADHARVPPGKPTACRRQRCAPEVGHRAWGERPPGEPNVIIWLTHGGSRVLHLVAASRVEGIDAKPWWAERAERASE